MSKRRIAAMLVVVALMELGALAACGAWQPASQQNGQTSAGPFTLVTVAGYTVPEDARGVTAIGNGALTEVSPVWYQPTESGSLIFASHMAEQSAATVTATAQSHQVALIPSISNYRNGQWDGALIHQIISDQQTRAAHIAAIVDMTRSHGWAGIDVDYESLRSSDRAAYSAFIGELGSAFHQAGKRLTVTVHAKTSEPGDWSGARAQDWKALGAAADETRVMAYDYSTESSAPGPIAPLPWVQGVLQLAVSEIPRDKIILGVATYGYDWSSGQPAQDAQWAEAQAIAQAHSAPVMWDPTTQEPWFAYTDSQGRPHTVWFEDARSLKAKLELAANARIGGIVIWRLGGEDPSIWPEIRQLA